LSTKERIVIEKILINHRMALLVLFIEPFPMEIVGGGLNDSLMVLVLGCARKFKTC